MSLKIIIFITSLIFAAVSVIFGTVFKKTLDHGLSGEAQAVS